MEFFFAGISGIGSLVTMGAILYASDNTTPEQRTLRIGIYESIYACSAPIGSILSGYLVFSYGFYTIFLLSIIGNSIACILLLVMIRETPVKGNHKEAAESEEVCESKTLPDQKANENSQLSDKNKNDIHHNVKSDELYPRIVEIQQVNKGTKNKRNKHKLYQESNLAYDSSTNNFERVDPTNGLTATKNGGKTNITAHCTEGITVNTKKILKANHEMNSKSSLSASLNPFKICLHNFRILLKPRGSHRTTVALIMIFITMLLDSSIVGKFVVYVHIIMYVY